MKIGPLDGFLGEMEYEWFLIGSQDDKDWISLASHLRPSPHCDLLVDNEGMAMRYGSALSSPVESAQAEAESDMEAYLCLPYHKIIKHMSSTCASKKYAL